MRVIDVFSCVGFHAHGLSWAGRFDIASFCEVNPWRRRILAARFPGVPVHDDITTMRPIPADVIFGGPPCQETSVAAAIHGRRSGASLWGEMFRLGLASGVEWFVVEQPPGNAAWEAQVAGDLSHAGFHVARLEFGANDVGAPYLRRRVFLLACANLPRLEVAWKAGPSAIERVARAADARASWHPDTIPAFDVASWRAEDVVGRREAIAALGDSNPPHMAEVIGHCLLAAKEGAYGR